MNSFSQLKLSDGLLQNLESLKYNEMTAIQAASIPVILQKSDILAQAKTGSGKTAAFGIGLLQNLNFERYRVQGIVLCPTRELAEQVMSEIRRIARFKQNIKLLKITGGLPLKKQELSLKHEAHIIVGTPGRVLKLLERGSLSFKDVKMVVLDEADQMLDMGFIEQIKTIINYAPPVHQTLCFSATFPDEIKAFSKTFLKNPKEIAVDVRHDKAVIDQYFYTVNPEFKVDAVIGLLSTYKPESVLIFCNTKEECKKLGAALNRQGVFSLALHGDLEQKDRTETLIRFTNGSSRILVATDIAARGLDISSLGGVINYNLPFETETYVHRIGRTGRAGKNGMAFSLVNNGEQFRVDAINDFMDENFTSQKRRFETIGTKNILKPVMTTVSINGGRKNKVSAGDLLGALTCDGGIEGSDVGKIDRLDNLSFVAIKTKKAARALKLLQEKPIKGKKFLARIHN